MKNRMKFVLCATIAAACFSQSGGGRTVEYALDTPTDTVSVATIEQVVDLKTQAKSAYLMDYATNTVIYSHKATERLPIASMCKIMTLLLCFEALESGVLDIQEEVCVSEFAASMGGSQVFLEEGEQVTWTLDGTTFSKVKMTLILDGSQLTHPSLLQPIVTLQ